MFSAVISFLSMLYEGWYIFNLLFSLYFIFSPFIILTLKPGIKTSLNLEDTHFKLFFNYFTKVLIVVNISALIYAVFVLSSAAYPDDVFTGLYGKYGFGSHSLSIINLSVCMYYYHIKNYKLFVFFLICGILGFYGLGIVVFGLTIFSYNISYFIKKIAVILK